MFYFRVTVITACLQTLPLVSSWYTSRCVSFSPGIFPSSLPGREASSFFPGDSWHTNPPPMGSPARALKPERSDPFARGRAWTPFLVCCWSSPWSLGRNALEMVANVVGNVVIGLRLACYVSKVTMEGFVDLHEVGLDPV